MASVLITGAREGLGRALAVEFAKQGWKTFAFSRSLEASDHSDIHWMKGDVTNAESMENVRKAVTQKTQSLDVLVNNAGAGSRGTKLAEITTDEVANQFQVHCMGALRVTQVFRSLLAAASRPVVVNVASRFGSTSQLSTGALNGANISYGYRIAKAAQNMLTQCLVHDSSLKPLTVVAINPGQLRTASASSDADKTPEEAASAIVNLVIRGDYRNGDYLQAFGKAVAW